MSSTPIAIEAPPSQTADPVSCRSASPTRGQDQPDHAAASSNSVALTVVSGLLLHVLDQLGVLAAGLAADLR